MINRLIHIYRSITTFQISIFELALNSLRDRTKKICYSEGIIEKNDFVPQKVKSLFSIEDLNVSNLDLNVHSWHVENWLKHKFDLLGTGWVSRNINAPVVGFLGFKIPNENKIHTPPKNFKHTGLAKSAIEKMSSNYYCIDWQKDIKSGFAWDILKQSNEQVNFLTSPYGVDVKIPWELARFNHLPLLVFTAKREDSKRTLVLQEFKDILYDFIAHNPYNMGINWCNAMEVGIRAINILLALDFAIKLDKEKSILDDDFLEIITQSIFEHAKFILDNSEYKNGLSNNHYYANISALLFIGAYFLDTKSGQYIYKIALREISIETKKQFLEDGGNFESSTHYHRLTLEMLLWNLILIENSDIQIVDEIKVSYWNDNIQTPLSLDQYKKELYATASRAIFFSKSITKNDGNIARCGDQDSGRYIKLSFEGDWRKFGELKNLDKQIQMGDYSEDDSTIWWVENDLSQRQIQVLGGAVVHSNNSIESFEKFPLEMFFSKCLSADRPVNKTEDFSNKEFQNKLKFKQTSFIPFDIVLNEPLEWHLFPNFGIYIAKSENIFLSVFASNSHSKKYWFHGKNDKLSFELRLGNKDIIVDPGSFIYSAAPELRNKFRSNRSHSSIEVKSIEQNRWPEGKISVFNLYNESKCELLEKKENSITLISKYRDVEHIRTFIIHNDKLEIQDSCNKDFKINFNYNNLYSNHYGRWTKH